MNAKIDVYVDIDLGNAADANGTGFTLDHDAATDACELIKVSKVKFNVVYVITLNKFAFNFQSHNSANYWVAAAACGVTVATIKAIQQFSNLKSSRLGLN